MAVAIARSSVPRMSGDDFRCFQETRPDHERWELVDGVPVAMTPPTMEHNRIASNLENLLNSALSDRDPSLTAVQRPGIEFGWSKASLSALGLHADYRPEPDVAVVDYDDVIAGHRFTTAGYLLAEVISSTDEEPETQSGERWIDTKRRLYQAHESCDAVVLIQQDRVAVHVFQRSGAGWLHAELTNMDDVVSLPRFGASFVVGDLYENTRWLPRDRVRHRP